MDDKPDLTHLTGDVLQYVAELEAEVARLRDMRPAAYHRLRRIEEAARRCLLTVEHGLAVEQTAEAIDAIRTALKEGEHGDS